MKRRTITTGRSIVLMVVTLACTACGSDGSGGAAGGAGGSGGSSSAPSSSSSSSSSTTSSSSSSAPSIAAFTDCQKDLDWLAWRYQREYRAALFGLSKAKDAVLSEVRFSTEDKSIWIKTQMERSASSTSSSSIPAQDSMWESVSPGYESTTWTDDTMDTFADISPRKGIFSARRRLTTELVPHVAQAYRTLECKLASLCQLLDESLRVMETTPQNVTVKVLGCVDVETTTFATCHLPSKKSTHPELGALRSYCTAMTESLRTREMQVTKLVTEYDAGYRSGIQFSGIFRAFLGQMRGVVLGSIRSATQMITSFSRIPCFIGACDANPSSTRPTTP